MRLRGPLDLRMPTCLSATNMVEESRPGVSSASPSFSKAEVASDVVDVSLVIILLLRRYGEEALPRLDFLLRFDRSAPGELQDTSPSMPPRAPGVTSAFFCDIIRPNMSSRRGSALRRREEG